MRIKTYDMIDKTYMDELKSRFVNAKTDAERDAVRTEMSAACSEAPHVVAEIMAGQLDETIATAKDMKMREKLSNILPAISMAYVARVYFGKSRAWLCQRINGLAVNGKRAEFTESEKATLEHALKDIAELLLSIRL